MTPRRDPPPLRKLATGVAGLDDVLGGGLPEFSFNLIVGGPGSGKTTLGPPDHVRQRDRRSAPASSSRSWASRRWKMLRYQQQYSFFDPEKVNGDNSLRLAERRGHRARARGRCSRASCDKSKRPRPGFVLVDSFRIRDADERPDADRSWSCRTSSTGWRCI